MGDPDAAARRLDVIIEFPVLDIDDATVELAETLFSVLGIPEKARDDALHIAIACRCEMDYLLSWNFKHIVNAATLRKLSMFISETNYRLPQICTPEELIS